MLGGIHKASCSCIICTGLEFVCPLTQLTDKMRLVRTSKDVTAPDDGCVLLILIYRHYLHIQVSLSFKLNGFYDAFSVKNHTTFAMTGSTHGYIFHLFTFGEHAQWQLEYEEYMSIFIRILIRPLVGVYKGFLYSKRLQKVISYSKRFIEHYFLFKEIGQFYSLFKEIFEKCKKIFWVY